MAASAKNGFLEFSAGPNGPTVQREAFSNTDVANAFATFYSNGALTFVIVKQDCWLTDIVIAADTEDTGQIQLFVNGTDVNVRWVNEGIVAAVNNRLKSPIGPIKAGSMIQLKELT